MRPSLARPANEQSGVVQKTDEVLVRDLRRSATELQRYAWRFALVGFEPTTSGV